MTWKAEIYGDPHFHEGPLPHYLSSVHVRTTPTGQSWAITYTSKVHPDSQMPSKRERVYVSRSKSEDHAIKWGMHRIAEKFRAYYEGTNLVQYARQSGCPQADLEWLDDFMDETFGDKWLYHNEPAMSICRNAIHSLVCGVDRGRVEELIIQKKEYFEASPVESVDHYSKEG